LIVSRARFVNDRVPNIVTFQGTYTNDGEFIAFFDVIDDNINSDDLASYVMRDCRYIKYILACDCVRFVLRPYDPTEEHNGFQYPVPTSLERQNLHTILQAIVDSGLDIAIAIVLPEYAEYGFKDPDALDTFYVNNNQRLIDNQIEYINQCLSMISDFSSDIRFIDYFGDFDPLDVYNRGIQQVQQKWFQYLTAEFGCSSNMFVEVVGSVDRPIPKIKEECQYLLDNGCQIASTQLYLDNTNYDFNVTEILQDVYGVTGDNLLIEEAGSNTSDFTDDGDYGRIYFRKVFEARNSVCPNVPVGLWCWGGDTSNGEWNWSLNRNIWDIRPCWWFIQEGASGLMWDLDNQIVYARRNQTNFIVFKNLPSDTTITVTRTCNWSNHTKDGEVYIGQWDRPISDNLAINEWWPNGTSQRQIPLPNEPDLELWYSVDFNWVDPNLFAKIEISY